MDELTNDRWRRFRKNKDRLDKLLIPSFQKAGLTKEKEKLKFCGKTVLTQDCKNCETKHFKGFKRCASRWCPNCQYVKRLIWLKKLVPVFEKERLNGNNIIKLNFTIKNGTNLEERLKALETAWKTFYDGRGSREIFKNRIIGGLRSLEVKLGKLSNMWHPHYHLLLVVTPEYQKDIAWILPRWKTILNKNCKGCETLKKWTNNIITGQAMSGEDLCFGCIENEGSAWIKSVKTDWQEILESVKYIIKPDEEVYQPEILKEAYSNLKGKRQTNTIGSLRGLIKDVEKEEKEQKEKLTELENFVCQLCKCSESELKAYAYSTIKDEFLVDLK